MTTINLRPQDFIWAQEKGANVKEPLQALKEKGWQYADIPTASNVNWLFNELGKWDTYLDKRIDQTKKDLDEKLTKFYDDLFTKIDETNAQLNETRRDLKMTIEVLQQIIEKVLSHHPKPPLTNPKLLDIKMMMVNEKSFSTTIEAFNEPPSGSN
jgi:hypothetical protein